MNLYSDLQLLQRVKENDPLAFRELFDRFWERLYRFAWKRLKSKQDAEDVVQQVFMKLWEHRESRQVETSLEQYLYRSVYYEVLAALKKALNSTEDLENVNENILPSFNNIQQRMGTAELDKVLEAAINALPSKMRDIYRLSREADMSVAEIATQLNLSEQTVKNQISAALTRIRKPLSEAMVLAVLSELTIW